MTFPLLFMSLADVHEPARAAADRRLHAAPRPRPAPGPRAGPEPSSPRPSPSPPLQDRRRHGPRLVQPAAQPGEPFLVEHLSPAQASARSHSESAKTFSLTRPGWDPAKMKWQVCYARTRDGVHFERPDLGIVPDPLVAQRADRLRRHLLRHAQPRRATRNGATPCSTPAGGPAPAGKTEPGFHPVHNAGAAFSADGLHWRESEHGPAFRDGNDAFSAIYDPRTRTNTAAIRPCCARTTSPTPTASAPTTRAASAASSPSAAATTASTGRGLRTSSSPMPATRPSSSSTCSPSSRTATASSA